MGVLTSLKREENMSLFRLVHKPSARVCALRQKLVVHGYSDNARALRGARGISHALGCALVARALLGRAPDRSRSRKGNRPDGHLCLALLALRLTI